MSACPLQLVPWRVDTITGTAVIGIGIGTVAAIADRAHPRQAAPSQSVSIQLGRVALAGPGRADMGGCCRRQELFAATCCKCATREGKMRRYVPANAIDCRKKPILDPTKSQYLTYDR
jgi:hypothetical protein